MDRNTPLYDTGLSNEARAKWLVSQMSVEEKFSWFSLRVRNDRLGIIASTCGGEGAHGVQARAGQGELYPPTPTTSFTQPIGMAATFDRGDRGRFSVSFFFPAAKGLPGFPRALACEETGFTTRLHQPPVLSRSGMVY